MTEDTDNDENRVPELYKKGSHLMEAYDADDFHTDEDDETITLVWTTTVPAEGVRFPDDE